MATKKSSKSKSAKQNDGSLPIYAIARALDMSSKELRETISSWDGVEWDVSSHMKKLDVDQQKEIEKRLGVSLGADDDAPSGGEEKKAKSKSRSGGRKKSSKAEEKQDAKQDGGSKDSGSSSKKKSSSRSGKAASKDDGKSDDKGQSSASKGGDSNNDDKKPNKRQSRSRKKEEKPAVDYVAVGKEWLTEALEKMGFSHPRVQGRAKGNDVYFDIGGEGTVGLIGAKSAAATTSVIEGFHQILERVLFDNDRDGKSLMIDVEGFRSNRAKALSDAASTAVDYAKDTGNKLRFAAINSFDRRAFHEAVGDEEGVRTESHGYGVRRRLEIWYNEPKNNKDSGGKDDDSSKGDN